MKKLFIIAIAAVLAAMCFTACTKESGDYLYHVKVSFNDNMDILTSAMDKGFQEAGLTKAPVSNHYWMLNGEKNACNKKAIAAFEARAKYLDENRSEVSILGVSLALKGEKVTLMGSVAGGEDATLATYTFVQEDTK